MEKRIDIQKNVRPVDYFNMSGTPSTLCWDAEAEEWFFSIVDVVGVLTDQPDARHAAKYWSVLKVRLKKEGSELPTNCSQLKMKSADSKRYSTDVANTEQLLRIIQSIPSKRPNLLSFGLLRSGVSESTKLLIRS